MQSLLQAKTAKVRAAAAIDLAQRGNRIGMSAIVESLRSDRLDDRVELLNRLQNTAACPLSDGHCNEIITENVDMQAPWVLARKSMIIQYFENRLNQKN